MNFTQENIARFENYSELTGNQKEEFERELQEDAELNCQFLAYKSFVAQLQDAEITEFTQKVKTWDEQSKETKPKKGQIYTLRFLVAAAVVTIGIVLFANFFFNSKSSQELAVTNFEPYPNVISIRGAKESIDDGLLAYDQKNYTEALQDFKAYPDELVAVFYAGESHMALKEYELAVDQFKQVLVMGGIFDEIATFHLALAYVGNEDEENAKNILKTIAEDSDYFSQSQALLKDLK